MLKHLAQYHAASYHFVQNLPDGAEFLEKNLPWIYNGGMIGQFMTKDKDVM